MNWHYASDGQPKGPISETELDALYKAGVIKPETMVWREGIPNWITYSQARGLAQPANPPVFSTSDQAAPAQGVQCVQCGQTYPADQVIAISGAQVCAGCKPIYVQRLREGGSPITYSGRRTLPVNADALIEEINQRDYHVDIGRCLSRSWELVKANPTLIIGTTLLVMICQSGGYIPVIGPIISIFLSGPLLGGLYAFYLKLIRNEPATVGDAFCGFSKSFGRLFGGYLMMCVYMLVWFIPGGLVMGLMGGKGGEIPGIILMLLGMIPAIYLAIAFTFFLLLMVDLDLGVFDSLRVSRKVVGRHWLSIFLLMMVGGLVTALGLVACCIGVIVTLPIFYAMVAYAYEDIFAAR